MTSPADDGRASLLKLTGLEEDALVALLGLIMDTEVSELELSVGKTQVKLRRNPGERLFSARGDMGPLTGGIGATENHGDSREVVTSPLVGIFHPQVSIGDRVQRSQPLGSIAALGMPTSVEAPHDGTIEDLLVPAETPVEYGQPLLVLTLDEESSRS